MVFSMAGVAGATSPGDAKLRIYGSSATLFPSTYHGWKSRGKNNVALPARQNGYIQSLRATFSSDVRTGEEATNGQVGRSVRRSELSRASSSLPKNRRICLQAWLTITRKKRPDRNEQMMDQMDVIGDLLGQNVTLQLVSVEVDPGTKVGKRSNVSAVKDWAEKARVVADKVQYTADFEIHADFGIPGAIIVQNRHQNDFFLEHISLRGHEYGPIDFPCSSWVHSTTDNQSHRVFFSNMAYLPSATPSGLKDLREADLRSYRGNGSGTRKEWENVYDYALYNDVGNGDKDPKLVRPIFGGSLNYPYPRRCRTGRLPAKHDATRESRLEGRSPPYVPRDESFEEVKKESYYNTSIRGVVHRSVPQLQDHFFGSPDEFESFEEIHRLYSQGFKLKSSSKMDVNELVRMLEDMPINAMLPDAVRAVTSASREQASVLRYPRPQILDKDLFAWLRDDEFARQTLAGVNPCAIRLLKEFPPVSKLDPYVYGPPKSAIKEEHIRDRLEGLTVNEALEAKRLFILDYHDVYLPFINRMNAAEKRAGYASRTIYFLTGEGTLEPLVIELSLPPPRRSQRVFLRGHSATEYWLWKLAKAHVSCNDAGFHQLATHWLRTHAVTEPYVIATSRQLSVMHPVYRLLHPHFRYTLEINATARQNLISAGGIIESTFQTGPCSMEISSAFYGANWRFDREGLPQDLIDRGMAVEDPTSPTGLRLVIHDYPYAADGLLLWTALETWVREYVSIFYRDGKSIEDDQELQSWWYEIRCCGHPEKKDEDWWPELTTKDNLIKVLTTMMWVASGFHAAVNFGQFAYAGFMPNKPTLTRRLIPEPGTEEWIEFQGNPERFLLSTLPSQLESTILMSVIESLSTHSPDEEYIGQNPHPKWLGGADATQAFKRFQESIAEIEKEIHRRNNNPVHRNRNGAGILPYELLLPTSGPGITGRGVPNSISI